MRSGDCVWSGAGDPSSFTTFESLFLTCKTLVDDDIGTLVSLNHENRDGTFTADVVSFHRLMACK
jgi:hypothetical protein